MRNKEFDQYLSTRTKQTSAINEITCQISVDGNLRLQISPV